MELLNNCFVMGGPNLPRENKEKFVVKLWQIVSFVFLW